MAMIYEVRFSNYKAYNTETDVNKKDLVLITCKDMNEVEKTTAFLKSMGKTYRQPKIVVKDTTFVVDKKNEKKEVKEEKMSK